MNYTIAALKEQIPLARAQENKEAEQKLMNEKQRLETEVAQLSQGVASGTGIDKSCGNFHQVPASPRVVIPFRSNFVYIHYMTQAICHYGRKSTNSPTQHTRII